MFLKNEGKIRIHCAGAAAIQCFAAPRGQPTMEFLGLSVEGFSLNRLLT
jgi:hypothetical protein